MDLLSPDHTSPVGKEDPEVPTTKPGTLGQYVGQPQSQQFGQVLKSTSKHGDREIVNLGFRGPGADPHAAPFSSDWAGGLHGRDTRPAAFLTMHRDPDSYQNYQGGPDVDHPVQRYYSERDQGHGQSHLQGTLFRSDKAKPWIVDEMYSHPEATHAIPTLMGVAADHTLSRHGTLPQSSEDLSQHSTRVVHGLAKHGVIEAPKNEQRNYLDFTDGERNADTHTRWMQEDRAWHISENSRELTTPEVKRGSDTFRGVLRNAKAARRSEFTAGTAHHPGQDVLPGMENAK